MFERSTGLGKFTPWKTKKIESYVRTLSFVVPREMAKRLGDVQGLLGTVADVRTGDILKANIEEAFSDGLDEAMKRLPMSAPFELAFETIVGRINTMLQRLLGDRGLSLGDTDVRGVIIAQRGRDVAAAVWGKPSLILFRRGIQGGPKLFNVLDAEPTGHPTVTAAIGFTNLITGKISGKDRMVIANRDLLELLDRKCLQEILSVPRSDTVTMLLRDALLTRHENIDLAMLMLDGYSGTETSGTAPADNETAVAEGEPVKTVRERQVETALTEEIVSPEGVPTLQPNIRAKNELTLAHHTGKMKKIFTETKKRLGQTAKNMRGVGSTAIAHGQKAVAVGLGAGRTIGRWAVKAMTVEQEVAEEQKDKEAASVGKKTGVGRRSETRPKAERADISAKKRWAALRLKVVELANCLLEKFRSLPAKSKKLFYVTVGLVGLFAISVTAIGVKRGQEAALAEYEKTVSEIRQQIDSAEASMIYRDETRARRLLEAAAAAVALLPEDDPSRSETKLSLARDVETRFAGLRHAMALDAPEVLSTVVTESGSPELRALTAVGANLWAAAADGTVFKISAEDGTATAVHAPANGKAPKIFVPLTSGVLVGDGDGLVAITTGGQVTTQTINAGEFELNLDDAAVFGSRLYLLDAAHNRILRFSAVSGGFASPQVYVKDGTDLSDAVSLTIDGAVYALSANGKIAKLMSGKSENFAVDAVDPPLVSPTVIRTQDASADLFVLDSGTPRVARFDKETGHLVAQYESPALSGATAIQVNQATKTILVTKGNQVLRFIWKEDR